MTEKTTFFWSYKEQSISAEEMLRRIYDLIAGPVETLGELDGDMYISDMRKLCDAYYHLRCAVDKIEHPNTNQKS